MADDESKEEGLKDWYTPRQARDLVSPILGFTGATNAILDLVAGDQIRVVSTSTSTRSPSGDVQARKAPVPITAKTFTNLSTLQHNNFWDGRITVFPSGRMSDGRSSGPSIMFFGLRLDPAQLHEHFPEAAAPPPVAPAAAPGSAIKNPGGRQKAEWREPLLIELAGQLHDLTLEPKILADLERAAKDWLGNQGEYPGERTVRNVVTPLWVRISKGGKNPTG